MMMGMVGLLGSGAATTTEAAEPSAAVAFERTGRPNDFLLCPADMCTSPADAPTPAFAVSPEAVLDAWLAVLGAAERTSIIAVDPERRIIAAEQRSALLGFVDAITIEVLVLPDGRTSFAAYSRSRAGYWDLGVNRRRLLAWTAAVEQRLTGR